MKPIKRMNEQEYEIYDLIRNAFHSQSGYFLNKQESYNIMLNVKEVFEARNIAYKTNTNTNR